MVLATSHTVGDKIKNGFTDVFAFIPELIGALLILIIGYFVAKIVGGVISKLLGRTGIDRTLTQGQGGGFVSRLTSSPSGLIGRVIFWVLFLGVIALAVSVLGINALSNFVAAIFAYLPNILAALLIFLVAGAIAGAIAALVARTMGDTPTGKIVGSIAPVLVMAIAAFMILDQLKIAEDIVRITYVALMGGLALALALAFGLGGRDVAARMLEGAYQAGQASRDQVKRDVQKGKQQAQQDLDKVKSSAQDRMDQPGQGSGGSTSVTQVQPQPAGTAQDAERVPADEIDKVPPGSVDDESSRARR